MKILLAASEVAPIIKVGGLGDVTGALPKALEKLDVNVDVIAPYFPLADVANLKVYKSIEINVPYAGENHIVSVFNTKLPDSNVDAILLQSAKFFSMRDRNWKPTREEEVTLFSFFDRAVVEYVKAKFNTYDLIHCNDWHTGLITHLLQDELEETRPATLFTIHNLMYQGISAPRIASDVGIVPGSHPLIDWDISDGDLNMVQQGITSADFINTVSPTYAKEILTPEFGGTLVDILQAREGRLTGILNGIDYTSFERNYDIKTWKKGKSEVKTALSDKIGLKDSDTRPLFGFVGRLDPYQKGLDLIYDVVEHIVKHGGNFVLLGDGDELWKTKFLQLSKKPELKDHFSAQLVFDLNLAKEVYAGSDFLLVPSKYEPCGLIQMIAMWYGTLPIVRATGGLKDSVKDGQTGFVFDKYDVAALVNVVTRALDAYKGQDTLAMTENALREDFGWEKSAIQYKELYKKVIQLRIKSL